MTKRERAHEILRRLRGLYTRQTDTFVQWSNALELVIAVVLSAQCTDKRINMVTPTLFRKYRTAADYAKADLHTLEQEIGSVTFYKSKARYLKGIGELLVARFNGEVPRTREELLLLPGVAYKSANLIMAKAHGQHVGVAVDTHVRRLAPRLGLTKHDSPNKISADLEKLFPPKDYLDVNEFMIMHGRAICKPRPLCAQCPLNDICPTGKKNVKKI
ncbi:MAG: endonuclease III [Candidatus Kerfeldbacteria bacterium]|nr:endonuclease III [Candidatus Kerfeldbacteria bacterium]